MPASNRRRFLGSSLAALGTVSAMPLTVRAQADYPNRPVKLMVPWPVGGATDIIARLLSEKLQAKLGQSFVVENRAGATGFIGTQAVLQAPPDGYTLLVMAASVHSFSPSMMKSMPFEAIKDFAPISQIVSFPYVMVVPANSPYNSVADIVAEARKGPNKVSYGSIGHGSASNLISEFFALSTGTKLVHIPYKGGSQALADLFGGQFTFLIDSLPSPLPHIQSGKLKALAVSSARRAGSLPDVPSISETLPGFEAISWLGIGGSPKLPPMVIERIGNAIREIAADPDYGNKLRAIGADPSASASPGAFREFLTRERARWTKVVADAGIPMID